MTGSLDGKLALVTGATRGIGRATAERLFSDGARVIVTGTKPDGTPPPGCEYQCIDFSDIAATQDFADGLKDTGIDILVNNAGINIISPFNSIDLKDFALIQQINVTAPFLLCKAVIASMKDKEWGRIVNVGSIWGKISKSERGAYATSKFALDGMTTTLAAEVAKYGILVNCIAPGPIDTELTRSILGDDGIEAITAQIPLGRLGRPEEVAALIAWLAGTENTYVSGQNIAIDGGLTRV